MPLSELKSALSPQQVITSGPDLEEYAKDWTKHFTPQAQAIVFPKSTQEVQTVVQWAIKHQHALVPSGGRTGLSAGAMATQNEIVLSLEKMNQVLNFDPIGSIVHCQAGVITESLQDFAKEKNLLFPIDFAAKGSSQIGGNIATNAGGIKVLRYGLTRDWVTSLTVVTGQGEILKLNNSLIKNATGYDLRHLFIGSEGTLGIITEAELQLTSPPKESSVLILGVDSLEKIMKVFQAFKTHCTLNAFEMFTDLALKKVLQQTKLSNPLGSNCPYYVLLEVENAHTSDEEMLLQQFENVFEKEWVLDGAMSQSATQAKEFWQLREMISESISGENPYKNDISVRVSLIPQFLQELNELLQKNYPDFEVVVFGHIGDGNLHVNILQPSKSDSNSFVKHCQQANQEIFSMLQKHGGSVSAEHGVGLVKKEGLSFTRSPEEITLMKQIKATFDPHGILNPGKIF